MLNLRDTCPVCEGAGLIFDEVWEDWYNGLRSYTSQNPDMDYSQLLAEYKREHPQPESGEEITCHECAGRGEVLTDDGKEIMGLVQDFS